MRTLPRLEANVLPRSIVIAPKMSDPDFEEFCLKNENVRIERTSDGVIRMNPPAGGLTGDGNSEIVYQLRGWWHGHHQGRVFDSSTGFYLPDGSMLSPDSAYVWPDRLAGLTRTQLTAFPRLAPNFVIELLSRSDNFAQTQDKMKCWIDNGVELGWLIDPYQKRVLAYRQSLKTQTTSALRLPGTGPVEGFVLDLAKVWGCYNV
jgi:Uma2 family endonuclease